MNNYILNEEEYVLDFIKNKKLEDIKGLNFLIKLLTRHYNKLGLDKKDIIKTIFNLTKDLSNLNIQEFELDKKIRYFVNKELNNIIELKEFNYIPLYQSELDKINTCKKDREKKFLFTCYILSYFFRNEWIGISYTDLFKLANISLSGNDRMLFIGDMVDRGFIDIAKKNTNLSLKIIMNKQGEEVFRISEINNLGNQFLAFNKKDIKLCSKCGKPIKIKSNKDNSTKYCEKCKHEKELEKYARYNEKR